MVRSLENIKTYSQYVCVFCVLFFVFLGCFFLSYIEEQNNQKEDPVIYIEMNAKLTIRATHL